MYASIYGEGPFHQSEIPYARFPAASTKGAQLFPLLYQCIFRLTQLGLTVVSVTCDGASDNHRMFSLHGTKKDLSYKTVNVFCPGKPPVFSYLTHLTWSKPLEIALQGDSFG